MNPIKFLKTLFCAAWMPLFFGGDSNSQANTTTSTTNTNFVTSEDKRIVASDQALALNGDGNLIDRSSQSTTNFSDTSNRSTSFVDNSDRSTSIINTTTDYGSISAALGGMDRVASGAVGLADHSVTGMIDSLKNTGDMGLQMVLSAFNTASRQSEAAQEAQKSVMDFSNAQLRGVTEAYSKANSPNNETTKSTLLGLIAAVAAVGIAIAMKR